MIGRIQAITFLAICQINTTLGRGITLATLPLDTNLTWLHLAKDQADGQGPWASCLGIIQTLPFLCSEDLETTFQLRKTIKMPSRKEFAD